MPVIQKQTFKATAKMGGVLSRIQDINEMEPDGIKFLVYGKSKTGKTRLVCDFPKPLLLIGTEKGTASVKGVKNIKFVRLQTSSEVQPLLEYAATNDFKTVALDTAGGLQDMCLKEILGLDELPLQKSWGMASRESYGTCTAQMKKHFHAMLSLTETSGMHVCIIAHERNFQEEGGSDMLAPSVGAALTPSLTGWLNGAVDYISQTYIRRKMTQSEQTVAGKRLLTSKPTGETEFCLRVGPHEIFMTGFRVAPGKKLPECIVDPTYQKIMNLINGE